MKSLKRLLLAITIASILVPAAVRADDPAAPPAATTPTKPWTNETEFSYISANGNTKSTTTSGKEKFTYTLKKTSLELFGGGLGTKSAGVVTAEQYNAGEKVSYKLSERNYTFEQFKWEKDRFAGIHDRFDSTAGVGRELIVTDTDKLIAELGGGYTAEDRLAGPNKDFSTGRFYTKYTRTVTATVNFSQDGEYIQNLDNPDDGRAKTETAVTAALSKHFSVKGSYVWKWVGVPPLGFGRSDTLTTISLLAVY